MLRCVSQASLERCARDEPYLARYHTGARDAGRVRACRARRRPSEPLIAYFCAEYGFHESFPIYSGGLGVLAGDYCKAASDERANFVAVGLLYEQGYFTQTVDNDGVQHAEYRGARPARSAGRAGTQRRAATGSRSACASPARRGGARLEGAGGARRRCICSTPTAPRTPPPIATSPIASTAAMNRPASARR